MGVVERIMDNSGRLTSTERKIAEVLAGEPQTVAFGTVAEVARRAGTSGPSVVRLAVKLGYAGFVDLQSDVQAELARQLGPARDRIRERPPGDLLARAQTVEQDNVARSLQGLDAAALERCTARLADVDHRVWVLSAAMTEAVGHTLAGLLSDLRDGVLLLGGSDVSIGRSIAGLEAGDVVIAIDIRRYERSVAATVRWAIDNGAAVVAITDSPLSPIAAGAMERLFISAEGIGPFDSMTGGIAVANVLATGVAARLRSVAPARLDTIEAAWSATAALVEEPGAAPARPSSRDGGVP